MESKLTKEFVDALREVVEDPYFYILTNKEVYETVCHKLGNKEGLMKFDTFRSAVCGRRSSKADQFNEFQNLMSRGKTKQKISLVKKLEKEDKSWQRYAWLLERKFDDFNKIEKREDEINARVNIPPKKWADGEN